MSDFYDYDLITCHNGNWYGQCYTKKVTIKKGKKIKIKRSKYDFLWGIVILFFIFLYGYICLLNLDVVTKLIRVFFPIFLIF